MSFGENLSYLRKKSKITQEELADKMFVTRQTVSRWETDSALPDVETLIKLCDILGCNMDVLVRGDAKENLNDNDNISEVSYCDLNEYDKHMNKFSLSIAIGVGLILLGVSLMLLLFPFTNEIWGVTTLLVFIAGAVTDFIISGFNHTNFMKNNPKAPNYPNDKKQKYVKKFAILIALATLLIFIGVIALILINENIELFSKNLAVEKVEILAVSLFMFLITISVFIYVYSGLIYSKYEVEKYNYECIKEGYIEGSEENYQKSPKHMKIEENVSSIIMSIATIIFLLVGFIYDLWHPAWIAFPIGAILSGIISFIINAFSKK